MEEKIVEADVVEENIEEIDVNEILVVEQVPKIFEDLEKIGTYLDKSLEGIDDVECTEINKQEVKNKRADINKTKTLLESKRKEIKAKIEAPYIEIEKKYNEFVKDKLDTAIATLDNKVASIEDEQKKNIKEKCESYFNEYAISKNIDFLKFENMNLKIVLGLATSTGTLAKKTTDSIVDFIEKVEKDLNLINTLEHSDEILIEYKKNLSSADAIAIVMDRHKQLEVMQQKKEEIKEQQLNDQIMLKKINKLTAPKIEDKTKELVKIAFEVIGEKIDLRMLVDFLKARKYEYKQLRDIGGHYE